MPLWTVKKLQYISFDYEQAEFRSKPTMSNPLLLHSREKSVILVMVVNKITTQVNFAHSAKAILLKEYRQPYL